MLQLQLPTLEAYISMIPMITSGIFLVKKMIKLYKIFYINVQFLRILGVNFARAIQRESLKFLNIFYINDQFFGILKFNISIVPFLDSLDIKSRIVFLFHDYCGGQCNEDDEEILKDVLLQCPNLYDIRIQYLNNPLQHICSDLIYTNINKMSYLRY